METRFISLHEMVSHTLLMLEDSPIAEDSAAPRLAAEKEERKRMLSRQSAKLMKLVVAAARMQNQ